MSLNGLIGIKDEVTQSSKEQKRKPSHIMFIFTVSLLRVSNIEMEQVKSCLNLQGINNAEMQQVKSCLKLHSGYLRAITIYHP